MLNSNRKLIAQFIRLFLILSFYLSNIFACNCSYEKNVIVRSNREYDYFGNVLKYEYDYFASYSSTSTSTPKKSIQFKYVVYKLTYKTWGQIHLYFILFKYFCKVFVFDV